MNDLRPQIAVLGLATELGGRLLLEQLKNAAAETISRLDSENELPTPVRENLQTIMVESFMKYCFNPITRPVRENGFNLTGKTEVIGYNSAEPLCYTPIQRVISTYRSQ